MGFFFHPGIWNFVRDDVLTNGPSGPEGGKEMEGFIASLMAMILFIVVVNWFYGRTAG